MVRGQGRHNKINGLEKIHCVRDAGVAGSNPATPTKISLGFLPLFPGAFKVNKGLGPAAAIWQRNPSPAAPPHRCRIRGNRVRVLSTLVILRESGVSSTLRPNGSITSLWNTGSPAFAGDDSWGTTASCCKQPRRLSLRDRHCERKRSNPSCRAKKEWIASSFRSLAQTLRVCRRQ